MNEIFQFQYLVPELIILFSVVLMVAYAAIAPHNNKVSVFHYATVAALVAALAAAKWDFYTYQQPVMAYGQMLYIDQWTLFIKALLLFSSILVVFLHRLTATVNSVAPVEYYSIFLFTVLGMLLTLASNHFAALFLNLEMMSLGIYILCSIQKDRKGSSESGVKYLLMGSFAVAFLLMGIALIYGDQNIVTISGFRQFMAEQRNADSLVNLTFLGILFFLVGLFFKVSFAPFHMWTPDVYEGAPTPITAFMSVCVKSVGFFIFIRMFQDLHWVVEKFYPVLSVVIASTFILANVAALSAFKWKRLLAYSSIAHAGYLGLGWMAAVSSSESEALLFYLATYSLMTLGSFFCFVYLSEKYSTGPEISGFKGLSSKSPAVSALLSFFLINMAGLPPTVGFYAKFLLFKMAVSQELFILSVIGVLGSAVSVFYYLRIIMNLYMESLASVLPNAVLGALAPQNKAQGILSASVLFALIICGLALLVLSVQPALLSQWL